MKNQFRIQVRETCEAMEYFDTLAEAQFALNYQEYSIVPDFYEIAELTLDGTYIPVES
jgi:hypothetical protein